MSFDGVSLVGRLAQLGNRKAQEQVIHRGVADETRLKNIVRARLDALTEILDQIIEPSLLSVSLQPPASRPSRCG